jgi:hypothetical protein
MAQIPAEKMALASTDIGTIVSTAATVVAAFYAAISYHRPRHAVSRPNSENAIAEERASRKWPILILALIAWGAVAYNWYIINYTGNLEMSLPLSGDNARLDVTKTVPVVDENGKGLYVDYFYSNGERLPL